MSICFCPIYFDQKHSREFNLFKMKILAWFHGHCECTVVQEDGSQVLSVCVIYRYLLNVKNLFRFSKFQVTIFPFLSPFVFFLCSHAPRLISKISQSRQSTLTLTLENWRGHFSLTFRLFSRSLSVFKLLFL